MATPNNLSQLESLPQDLLGEILSRVASSSREDIRNCLTVSRTISEAVQDDRVFKNLSLRQQAMNPLSTYGRYHQLMERCLRSENPAAHFIEGIKHFFVQDSTTMGLFHLKKSSEGSYDNGTYLYGLLLLCTGNRQEGRMSLRSLGWEVNKRRADRCWRATRLSLRNIIIIPKNEYTANLTMNRPPQNCHLDDLDTRCRRCYYYKQMRKFIAFIQ
ncbi:hypothetical protein N665_0309s0045 [Sinapis alba]|nr:hypothetical protein N665_0309s0045 [Sinapis alba]